MNRKAVIILSGGIDSTTLLYDTAAKGYEVSALTFIYGQKHEREIDSARAICGRIYVPHMVVDLSGLKPLLSGSALTDPGVEIPDVPESAEHYDTLKATIVPNRNAIFLSIAVGYAVSTGAGAVLFGAHNSDRGVYPDCRAEFVEAFEAAERLATDMPQLPYAGFDKSEIVGLGDGLGVPFGLAWSCYKGGDIHCGVCSSCRERKRAFAEAGVLDPTGYRE